MDPPLDTSVNLNAATVVGLVLYVLTVHMKMVHFSQNTCSTRNNVLPVGINIITNLICVIVVY
jgi:hypothetical protein